MTMINLQELPQGVSLLLYPNPLFEEVHLQPTKMCMLVRLRKTTKNKDIKSEPLQKYSRMFRLHDKT